MAGFLSALPSAKSPLAPLFQSGEHCGICDTPLFTRKGCAGVYPAAAQRPFRRQRGEHSVSCNTPLCKRGAGGICCDIGTGAMP